MKKNNINDGPIGPVQYSDVYGYNAPEQKEFKRYNLIYTDEEWAAFQKEQARKKSAAIKNESIDDVAIGKLSGGFFINPIKCFGKYYRIKWSDRFVSEGVKHRQENWVKVLATNRELILPSGPIIYSTLRTLYQNRNGPKKDLVEELKEDFSFHFSYFMMTSTRIKPALTGLDRIVHNYLMPTERQFKCNFCGENTYVTKTSSLGEQMAHLFGTDNLEEIKAVFEWVSGVQPYIWRTKPKLDIDSPLILGTANKIFNIICSPDANLNAAPALLIALQEVKKPF